MNLFKKSTGSFYHEYESFSEQQRMTFQLSKLKQFTEVLKRSEFYSSRLQNINIDSKFPFQNFPVLTSTDLRQNLPPIGNSLLGSEIETATVFQSGGTTGTPKTSLFSYNEMELINQCNARGFFASGLTPEDKVANLWAVGGLYMTFVHMNRILMEYGCLNFPFSNQTPVEFVKNVATQFKINCFTGITSVVLNALRTIHSETPNQLKVNKIYFGGEHIYDSDREEMKTNFGAEIIRAPGYGTIDSWYLGYQCTKTENGIFHAFDDMVH